MHLEFRIERLKLKMKEQSTKMRLQSQMIKSIKGRAIGISAASDIVEKKIPRGDPKDEKQRSQIVKMGKKADLILKTINDGQAKLDYIRSGQAARDEWKKQRELRRSRSARRRRIRRRPREARLRPPGSAPQGRRTSPWPLGTSRSTRGRISPCSVSPWSVILRRRADVLQFERAGVLYIARALVQLLFTARALP